MKNKFLNAFNKVIDKLKKYFKENSLFVSYVILMLLISMLLRMCTVGYAFSLKPFASDLVFVVLTGSFGYLIKPKGQNTYYFVVLLLFSILSVVNAIYYEFYQSFVSVNLLATITMVGEVDDAVYTKVKLIQFAYLLAPIILVVINKKNSKNKITDLIKRKKEDKKRFKNTIITSVILLCLVLITLSSAELSRIVKQWNREYIVQRFGIYVYTINDLVQSVKPQIDTLFGYDEAYREFREFYEEKDSEIKETNKYTNILKGKNVVFIHMESIQSFLVNLRINGVETTPNINRLINEGLYFSKFYPQISVGTSSDTEFTLLTGLMPSSSGTVFVSYSNRKYEAMPQLFGELGYYTFSMHANNADYWNRKVMHKNLGYNKFYAKDSYEITDENVIGLGLSDEAFLNQSYEYLKEISSNNTNYMGTIITLSNHSPFSDTEKYGEYDLTMRYTAIDELGNEIEKISPYLENTYMGNYLKSVHYADYALGKFFDLIRSDETFNNTVFILYGDHEAKLGKKEFNNLYNFDPYNEDIKEKEDPTYISLDNYVYDLMKNTPFIIWTKDELVNGEVDDVMGMYDVLPTVANMFGFKSKYALGNDIFSSKEKIVVFPNLNILTNKVYYNNLKDEYITFGSEPIESDYIENLKKYATKRLEVSNGIVVHDLLRDKGEVNEKSDEIK